MQNGKDYIFGYGSLINIVSRNNTCTCTEAFEATILGYKRGWYYKDIYRDMTELGLLHDIDHDCNGVLIQVSNDNLQSFDKREVGYERVLVPFENVVDTSEISSFDRVWVYVLKQPILPTEDFPITQSYVDIVLSGCLNFSEKMARDLIRSTFAWKYAWIDNRSGKKEDIHMQIDTILIDELDDMSQRIKR